MRQFNLYAKLISSYNLETMHDQEITVYSPNYRSKIGFFQTWVIMFRNIVKSRELIFQLFRRDFLMAYKKSFLGMTWIFISPLIGIVSWVFLNYAGILAPGDVGIPFPAFVLLSSSLWGLFMGFYSSAAGTLGAGSAFILQVKYPHEALLIKQTAQHLANFLITFLVNIIVLLLFGIVPSWQIILFPLMAIPLFLLGAGLGLFVSVITVVAQDLSTIIGMAMGILFYLTPIVYVAPTVESEVLRRIIDLNPLTYLIGGMRDVILYGHMDHPFRYFICVIVSIFVFLLSWRLFFVSEDKVVEKML